MSEQQPLIQPLTEYLVDEYSSYTNSFTPILEGELLTIIDAAIIDPTQRKATKDLIREKIRRDADRRVNGRTHIFAQLYKALHQTDNNTGPAWVINALKTERSLPDHIQPINPFLNVDLTK
jgi:hypothetical protein